jgi:AraC family transcriptional regulator, arabinose operon regulatory protein
MMAKRIVAGNTDICDINIMPPACRNRFVPLWSATRKDFLLGNGIVHCGLGENRKGYAFGRKNPEFHVAIFTRGGRGACRDGKGHSYTISKGDLAVFPAHCPHHYAIAGATWDHFWFHFTDTDQWSFLRSTDISVRKASCLEDLERLLVCYYNEAMRDDASSAGVLWNLGESILHYLRRELDDKVHAATSEAGTRLNLLMSEMRRDQSRQWSLKEIAAGLCCSRIHAIRLFRAKTGQTPFEYLTQGRMQFAAHLLLFSSDKIRTIAAMVGYTDQFAFSVAFSRYHGLSPREFRKRNAAAF